MKRIETKLIGVAILETPIHRDTRGAFWETFRADSIANVGLDVCFIQDAMSLSRKNTLRGLHFQAPPKQGKLVGLAAGTIYDVVVDIRQRSPTFGCWIGTALTEGDGRLIWIPPGFAHGFVALSDNTIVTYKLTNFGQDHEQVVRWDDPDLAIAWPVENPIVSERDAAAPLLRDAPVLPYYEPSS